MRVPGRRIAVLATGALCLFALLVLGSWIEFTHSFSNLGADLRPLELTIKKSAVDSLLLIRQPHSSVVPPNEYSARSLHDLAALKADEKLFDTWQVELQLGEQTLKNTIGDWVRSSANVPYAADNLRVDAWGHSFCLLRRANSVIVLSAGPKAASSPVCRNIRVTAEELAELPRARMLETPSGNLILALDQKAEALEH
jgi:hypothetical protein